MFHGVFNSLPLSPYIFLVVIFYFYFLNAFRSLSFNNFKGEIPKEIANLPELRYLYLQENRLTGRIPPELGTLPNLRHL